MSWHAIPGWPDYQINERRQVRNTRGYLLTPTRAGVFYLWRSGQKEKVTGAELWELAFFPPLYEPPPEPAPEPAKPHKSGTALDIKTQREVDRPKRRCATCKRPTHNYRCDACWRKLRGEAV